MSEPTKPIQITCDLDQLKRIHAIVKEGALPMVLFSENMEAMRKQATEKRSNALAMADTLLRNLTGMN